MIPAYLQWINKTLFLFIFMSSFCLKAQDHYPNKTLRLLIPGAASGGTDIIARLLTSHLTNSLGHNIIIDNRTSGGHSQAPEIVARARPDGYTLLLSPNSIAVHVSMYKNLKYDLLKDLISVSPIANFSNILLVAPSLKSNSLQDLIRYIKNTAKQLNYASSGNGGTGHLAMELLKSKLSIELVHIPYKSGSASLLALLSYEVPIGFVNVVPALPQVSLGKLKALAVSGKNRLSLIPDVPTISESGVPDFDANAWFGVFAPSGTNNEIISLLNKQFSHVLKKQEIINRFARDGGEPMSSNSNEFRLFVESEIKKWQKIIQLNNIVAD